MYYYIIYGEIEITMLNREFEEKWIYNCPDIVTDIKIIDHKIQLYYFEGEYEGWAPYKEFNYQMAKHLQEKNGK